VPSTVLILPSSDLSSNIDFSSRFCSWRLHFAVDDRTARVTVTGDELRDGAVIPRFIAYLVPAWHASACREPHTRNGQTEPLTNGRQRMPPQTRSVCFLSSHHAYSHSSNFRVVSTRTEILYMANMPRRSGIGPLTTVGHHSPLR
jgi:hypothetical protein